MTKKLVGVYPLSRHKETFDIRKSSRFRKSKIMLYLLDNPLSTITQVREAKISGKSISKNHDHINKDIRDLVSYGCIFYLPFLKKYFVNSPNQRRDRIDGILFFVCLNNFYSYLKNNSINLPYFLEQITPFSKLDRYNRHKHDKLVNVPFTSGIDNKKPLLDQVLIKLVSLIQLSEKIFEEHCTILKPTQPRSIVNNRYWNYKNMVSLPFLETDFFRYYAFFIILIRYRNDLLEPGLNGFSKKLDNYYEKDKIFLENLKSGEYVNFAQKLSIAEEYEKNGRRTAKEKLANMLSQFPSKNNFLRLESVYDMNYLENSSTVNLSTEDITHKKDIRKIKYDRIEEKKREDKIQAEYKKKVKKSLDLDKILESIIGEDQKVNLEELLKDLKQEIGSGFLGRIKPNYNPGL